MREIDSEQTSGDGNSDNSKTVGEALLELVNDSDNSDQMREIDSEWTSGDGNLGIKARKGNVKINTSVTIP